MPPRKVHAFSAENQFTTRCGRDSEWVARLTLSEADVTCLRCQRMFVTCVANAKRVNWEEAVEHMEAEPQNSGAPKASDDTQGKSWSFEAEIEDIKTDHLGLIEIGGSQADAAQFLHVYTLTFKVRMKREDAKGFGIGARVRVTVEKV